MIAREGSDARKNFFPGKRRLNAFPIELFFTAEAGWRDLFEKQHPRNNITMLRNIILIVESERDTFARLARRYWKIIVVM